MPPRESKKKKTRDTSSSEKEATAYRRAPNESARVPERGSEILEHAKSLESKMQKLKEHAIDTDEIAEIEQILKDAKGYFAKFSDKKEKGKSVDQLEERRKIAEQKLTSLNQRMVHILEKMGQKIPDALAHYAGMKSSDEEKKHAKKHEGMAEIHGVDVIQPRENDSEGPLGDSEIGGVNVIAAGEEVEATEEEKSVESNEVIPDAIQISSGGKTYEFGWHEEVTYTSAKGKELSCIVMGKSKDAKNPGLILKDLEKGKVFAVGADSIAKRVDVRDREAGHVSSEANQKQVAEDAPEDDDIFGVKDNPVREETKWPASQSEPEESLETMVKKARVAVEHETKQKMAARGKTAEKSITATEDEDVFGIKGKRAPKETKWPESREESMEKMLKDAKAHIDTEGQQKIKEYEKGTRKSVIADDDVFGDKNRSVPEETKWPESHEESMDKMLKDAKTAVEDGMEEGIEKFRQAEKKKRKEKYEAELHSPLPPVMVNKEALTRADRVEKGETQTPKVERKNIPDVPSVIVDEEYQAYRPPVAARERKTYKEVSEKKAIQMIEQVAEAFEKSWGGMQMTVVEKQKTGWFRSKKVEREMTDEEKKAQLGVWLDSAEQAFDSLDKKKHGTNLEKPVLMWHEAKALIRRLEVELQFAGRTIENKKLTEAFDTMTAEVEESRVELEEKQEKRSKGVIKPLIANWVTRISLGMMGAMAVGQAEPHRGPEAAVASQISSRETTKSDVSVSETVGESQRNILSFLTEANQMMTESMISVTPFMVDSGLAAEIKDGKKVPNLASAELAPDGTSVKLTFDNNKTVEGYPEKVQQSGKEYWKLKRQEKKESQPGHGERVLAEVKQVFADAKKQYPELFGTEASKPRQKKNTVEAEIEKKLRQAEMDPESGEARRQIEEVKKMIDEVRPGVDRVSQKIVDRLEENLELPEDVFVRFGVKTSEDPEAAKLAQEWTEADKALKAAKESGSAEDVQERTAEVKKILEEITKKYSE